MFSKRVLMAALMVGSCAIPASATLTTYSSVGSLEAALPGDTFSNITFAQGSLGASTTADGIVFSTDSASGLTGVTDVSGWPAGTAINVTNAFADSFYTITISLPSGVNAIAFNVDDQTPSSTYGVSVTDSGGTLEPTFTQSGSTPTFYAVATTDLTFISFTVSNDTFGTGALLTLGNVTIGEADTPPAPEGATMLLVGTGLLVMGYWRRKAARRRRAARTLRPVTA